MLTRVVLVAVLLAGCAAQEAAVEPSRQEPAEQGASEVVLSDCGVGDRWMEATVEVTNRTSKRSNYMIEVAFTSPDKSVQLDTAYAMVSGLAPGQQATKQASTVTESDGPFECEVLDVTRLSDEG